MDMESRAAGLDAGKSATGAGAHGGSEAQAGSASAARKGGASAGVTRSDAPQNAAPRGENGAAKRPSDDEILGLDLGVRGRAGKLGEDVEADAGRARGKSEDEILFGDEDGGEACDGESRGSELGEADQENRGSDSNETADEKAAAQDELTPEARAAVEANPELGKIVEEAAAYRGIFPSVEAAREVAGIFPNADAARAARGQVAELNQIDALFSANRPEAHAELAAAIQRLNPEAFQSLARMMKAVAEAGTARSAGPDSGRAAERVADGPGRESATGDSADARGSDESRRSADAAQDAREAEKAQAARAVSLDAQRAFFHEANAAAVEGVLGTIRQQVDRLLPEEISEGARKRVVGDIYRELGGALESTAGFSDRVRQVFGAGRFDGRTRDAVVRVILDQARQSIPGITKKVINEWTTNVVGASKARAARQKTAEGRVDIAGGSPGAGGKKALMPRDLDYRRLSDADILNL
jgi:hypothetical protein